MIYFESNIAELRRVLSPSRLNPILRQCYAEVGAWWVEQYMDGHFTHAGAKKYGYTPRSGEAGSGRPFRRSYTERKLRKFGHTLPLVWSRESLRLAKIFNIQASSKQVKVTFPGLRKLNFRPKGGRIDMADEVTRTTVAETAAVAAEFVRRLEGYTAHAVRAAEREASRWAPSAAVASYVPPSNWNIGPDLR